MGLVRPGADRAPVNGSYAGRRHRRPRGAAQSAGPERRDVGGGFLRRRDVTQRFDARGHHLRRLLIVVDTAALALAFALTVANRHALGSPDSVPGSLPLLALALPAWLLLAHTHGLYHVDSRSAEHGAADEAAPALQMSTLWAWSLLLVLKLTHLASISIGELAFFWGASVTLFMALRAAARARARRRPWYRENAVVIGTGAEVTGIIRKISRHPEWGLNVVACIDHAGTGESIRYVDEIPIVRGEIDALDLIEKVEAKRVIIAWESGSAHTPEQRFALVRELSDKNIHVNLIPSWFEVLGARLELRELEGMPLLSVPPMRLGRSSLLMKRALDVVVSLAALVLLAPMLVLYAIAIKLDSRGPVFFRQRRVGRNGRCFELLKFRSMTADADDRKHEVAELNAHGGGIAEGMFKIPVDPRVTRVGALSTAHLDRRAAAALEHPAWGHEPGRPASADRA